ncbi:fibrinogen-binding protein [Ciceribacter thiooxidans]|uniref:Fibrinogen-binding protein n=1 Tax=Ciceribacter thiooxidans TaxID=1969821 RepID=A0ABV7I9S4_9HYPH|nr:fibrinogen-binding protein [Ciceribacter thiooxidans]
MSYDPKGSDTENNVGALADGFANSAINSTEVDDGSTGYVGGVANGDNRNNTDNSTDVDVDAKVDIAANNGDNRDNDYDWSYDSKSYSNTETDTDIKMISDNDTKTVTDTDIKTDYDWSYDSKSYSNTETDTDIKTVTDTDIKTVTETATDSYNSTDTDFAVLDDVKDNGNLGIAGGDLTFNLGDDFSFTLDVDNILNDSLNGQGNDAGFSAVQANHLADQDSAWNVRMDNGGAMNQLSANGGDADSAEGMELDGKCWDLKAGDDVSGSSTADASAILANSGFHFEFVQGANLLGNTIDSSIIGGDSHVSDVGEDTGA